MRELSLNILDIAQNSIAAGASLTEIVVAENTREKTLLIGIYDNGKGMTEEQVRNVQDPFFTTRTTRKVGMGIPLFKMAAEQTGGSFTITSEVGVGTRVEARFKTDSIDFTPLGDMSSTITTIVCMNEDKDFIYIRSVDDEKFEFSSAEIKAILDGVPLSEPSVMSWVEGYITEHTEQLFKN
ncbi:MAG: sensor histidine kinase [Clostridia bacterium]|nr:sensor histidine kinase [Clostridia bacterium]